MPLYAVEMTGTAREVYLVDAPDEVAARTDWTSGDLLVQEASSMEVVAVELRDEEA
jgi:hypothetical protein